MNILPFIPPGWLTPLGVAIKILAALLAVLTAIQGGDVATIAHELGAAAAVFGVGSGLAALGLRRAIARSIPVPGELVAGELRPLGITIDGVFHPIEEAPAPPAAPAPGASAPAASMVLLLAVGLAAALAGGCYPQINGPAISLSTTVCASPAPPSAGVRPSGVVPPS